MFFLLYVCLSLCLSCFASIFLSMSFFHSFFQNVHVHVRTLSLEEEPWKTNTDLIIIIPNGHFGTGQFLLVFFTLVGRVIDRKLFVDEYLLQDLILGKSRVIVFHQHPDIYVDGDILVPGNVSRSLTLLNQSIVCQSTGRIFKKTFRA